MKRIIVIDSDNLFVSRLKKKLTSIKVINEIQVEQISPDPKSESNVVEETVALINSKIENYLDSIAGFFVDIVVFNDKGLDSHGVEIAISLKEIYPEIPCYCVTGMLNSEYELDIFSEATLSKKIDGILSKGYLNGKGFSKSRLEKLLDSQNDVVLTNPKTSQHFDVVIITALFDDEFESIKKLVKKADDIRVDQRLMMAGSIDTVNGKSVKILCAYQVETGPIDTAVMASSLVERFKPKFLIMTGVCGGSSETDLKDIIIASKVTLYDKGKETDKGFLSDGVSSPIDSLLLDLIKTNKSKIISYVSEHLNTEKYDGKIHVQPMGCGLSVINKKGYLDSKVKSINRNTIAVDMESYSIARCCEMKKDSNTKAIIIKSVMDNTLNKEDSVKKHASFTSALCAKYLISNILFD